MEPPRDTPPSGEGFATGPDGTRLFYEWEGSGEAVVLSDGIACDGFIWKYLRRTLASRYRVIHWNYRAHGRSGAPRDPARIDVADHARDLHCVLEHLGVKRAALLAHSMGTQVSLEAYRQHPDRVAGMALLCGSYGRITRTFHGSDALFHALPHVIDFLDEHPRVARAMWSRAPVAVSVWVARFFDEVDVLRLRTEDLVPYFEHIIDLDPRTFFRMVRAAGEHTAEDILPAITAPVLVVAAERDTFTPTRYAEQMARQIPGAELLRVVEGSHTAPLEQPTLINQRILEFLGERVFPDGGA